MKAHNWCHVVFQWLWITVVVFEYGLGGCFTWVSIRFKEKRNWFHSKKYISYIVYIFREMIGKEKKYFWCSLPFKSYSIVDEICRLISTSCSLSTSSLRFLFSCALEDVDVDGSDGREGLRRESQFHLLRGPEVWFSDYQESWLVCESLMMLERNIRAGVVVRLVRVPKYAMVTTSTSANSNLLSMFRSRTTLCSKPPMVIVVPMVTLGPSVPHLLVDSQLAKCAWIGKGREEWVRTMYWLGVMVNVRSLGSKVETVPVTVI